MKRLLAIGLACLTTQAATWYVSPYGTNTNRGNGPAPSQAWRTITCALVTSNAFLSPGDTVYIAPGTYRGAITLNKSYAGTPLYVRGDPRNEQGFTDTSGNRITARYVRLTSSSTDKDVAGVPTINVQTYTNYSFFDMLIDSSANSTKRVFWFAPNTAAGSGFSFTRCVLFSIQDAIYANPAANCPVNLAITNCILLGVEAAIYVFPASAPSAELNLGVNVDSSIIYGNYGVYLYDRGGTYAFTGVNVLNSTFAMNNRSYYYSCTASTTPTGKNTIKGNLFLGTTYGIYAGSTPAFNNTYNIYMSGIPRGGSGVSAGTGEQTSWIVLSNLDQDALWFNGAPTFCSPLVESVGLGFRTDIAGGGTDLLGRIRPSGSGAFWGAGYTNNAVGALECHDFGVKETGVVSDGTYSLKLTGPGDHLIKVPVNSAATTLTIQIRKDSTYSGNQPAVKRVAQPELISGDTGETKTMSVGAGTWETLTFTSFTPTRKGVVYLIVESYDVAGNGNVYVDNLTRNY